MSKVSKQRSFKKLGKAQAREQFAPIVEYLSVNGGVVEVSDYGKVAAVIMNHKDYLWLLAQAREPFKPEKQLANSAELVGDLETASLEISETILGSVEKSARKL